jgi:hypothetical protein
MNVPSTRIVAKVEFPERWCVHRNAATGTDVLGFYATCLGAEGVYCVRDNVFWKGVHAYRPSQEREDVAQDMLTALYSRDDVPSAALAPHVFQSAFLILSQYAHPFPVHEVMDAQCRVAAGISHPIKNAAPYSFLPVKHWKA